MTGIRQSKIQFALVVQEPDHQGPGVERRDIGPGPACASLMTLIGPKTLALVHKIIQRLATELLHPCVFTANERTGVINAL